MMYLTVTPDKRGVMNVTITYDKKDAKPFSVKTVNETQNRHELEFSLTSTLARIKPPVPLRRDMRLSAKPITTHEEVMPLEYMFEVVINPLTGKGGKSPRMRLSSDYQRTRLLLKKRSNNKISCDSKDWIKGTEAYYIQCIHALGKGFLCIKERKCFIRERNRQQQQERQNERERQQAAREAGRQGAGDTRGARQQREQGTGGRGREEGGEGRGGQEGPAREGQEGGGEEGGRHDGQGQEEGGRDGEDEGEERGTDGEEGQGGGGAEGGGQEEAGIVAQEGQAVGGTDGEEGQERREREGRGRRGREGSGQERQARGAGGRDTSGIERQERAGGQGRGEGENAAEKECKIEDRYKMCVKGVSNAHTIKQQHFMLFRLQPAQL